VTDPAPDPADLERFEYHAFADLVAACPAPLAAGLGLSAAEVAGGPAIRARAIAGGEFNRAALLPGAEPEGLIAHLRQGGPGALLQLAAPLAFPALEDRLAALGCRPATPWVMLTRGPGRADPGTTRLKLRALSAEDAAEAGIVFVRGYGMPDGFAPWIAALIPRRHWQGFGAFDGAVLVGVGFLYQEGARAIMLGAATLPEARGRGAQTALLAHRLAVATAAGARLIQSHTGLPAPGAASPSLNNMRRAGFRDAHLRLNWRLE
jgi:GNAT superfamily N-acetyltransferase